MEPSRENPTPRRCQRRMIHGMDSTRFDALVQALVESRRSLLAGGLTFGLGQIGVSPIEAKSRKRKRKKKPKRASPNTYGCLDVGDPCQTPDECCSGVCDGSKGKRTCRAHDTGTCKQDGQLAPCNNRTNCGCFRTTGGYDMCSELFPPSDCADCRRDADCEALGFPQGSACVPFDCESGFACMVPCGKAPPAPQS